MRLWLSKIRLWEIALAVFLGFGCYFLWATNQNENQIVARANATFSAADAAITNINSATLQVGSAFQSAAASASQTEKDVRAVTIPLQQTVALINAPCVPGPCGTVADVGKTLNTIRLTSGQIEIAANHEDNNLANLDNQENQVFVDTDTALKNFNTLLVSPALNDTLINADTITTNLGKTTGDFQAKFHDFLYPPPCKGFKCDLKKIYETVKIGSQFSEPAYWSWALFSQIKP
jgi:hypothetical protein